MTYMTQRRHWQYWPLRTPHLTYRFYFRTGILITVRARVWIQKQHTLTNKRINFTGGPFTKLSMLAVAHCFCSDYISKEPENECYCCSQEVHKHRANAGPSCSPISIAHVRHVLYTCSHLHTTLTNCSTSPKENDTICTRPPSEQEHFSFLVAYVIAFL